MARAERVSPFFTNTRVVRDLEAVVLGLVLPDATVAELFGFVLLDDPVALVRGLEELLDVVSGLTRDDSAVRVEVEFVMGVILAGGLSFAASNVASSASGDASFEKVRRVHLEGLSAHAST